MADFDLKSIAENTTGPSADTEVLFGAVDQSTGTPKPYQFAGIKLWLSAMTATFTNKTLTAPVINSPTGIVKADVGLGNVPNVDAAKLAHPGYKANVYYAGYPWSSQAAGGAPNLTTAYFSLVLIGGNSSVTVSSLAARITTLGTTNIQLALYADDTTVAPHRPGALIANTGNIVNTATGTVAGTFTGVSIAPGWYWIGLQVGDITVRYAVPAPTSNVEAFLIGSATLTSFLNPSVTTGVNTTTGITSFGTWPASLNGSTWTEGTSLAPIGAVLFSSVP